MKNRIKKRIVDYVLFNYKPLDINQFIKGKTLFNHKCHLNSVQEALDNGYKVLLTICIGNDDIFVHFINQNSDGKYIDTTLGWYGTELYDYYLVRNVNSSEYHDIWNALKNTKKMLIQQNSNCIERLFKMISEDDV